MDDEQSIQLVKGLDERVLKTAIAQAEVSSHFLEDQLRLIPARVENINPKLLNMK